MHQDVNSGLLHSPSPQHKLNIVPMFASHRLGSGLDEGPWGVAVVVPIAARRSAVAHSAAKLILRTPTNCTQNMFHITESTAVITILPSKKRRLERMCHWFRWRYYSRACLKWLRKFTVNTEGSKKCTHNPNTSIKSTAHHNQCSMVCFKLHVT
jgi:hypothetical protein